MSSIGAADTGQSKKKNSVRFSGGTELHQIVPPSVWDSSGQWSKESSSSSCSTGASIGRWGAATGSTRLSISAKTPMYRWPDDVTPNSRTFKNINTNYIFGTGDHPSPGYDTHTGEYNKQNGDIDNGKNNSSNGKEKRSPGQRIVLFAIRLALIEKAASGIGKLAFLWATVVILGGFASTVTFENFWVVTLIILAESSRIFSRSHELEMQQLYSKSDGEMSSKSKAEMSSKSIGGMDRCQGTIQRTTRSMRGPSTTANNHWLRRLKASSDTPDPLPTVKSATSPLVNARRFESRWRWSITTLPLLPYVGRVITTHVLSHIHYLAQLTSAMMCIGLSLWRLTQQNFYEEEADSPGNVKASARVTVSMNVFYALAILEAGLFLLERSYWEYRIRFKKLLDEVVRDETGLGKAVLRDIIESAEHVRDETGLGKAEREKAALLEIIESAAHVARQFFYDVYSRCLAGSIFDGLDMDLVSYSISWIQYEGVKHQLDGARVFNRFVLGKDDKFASDALRRLGTTPGIIERLVEMLALSWKSTQEKELLQEIATIIRRMVVHYRNCSRFVAVPGFTDAVVALLWAPDTSSRLHADEDNELKLRLNESSRLPADEDNELKLRLNESSRLPADEDNELKLRLNESSRLPPNEDNELKLRWTGLSILEYLCKDHKNCAKIGETKGLVHILMLFIEVDAGTFAADGSTSNGILRGRQETLKRSLQVLLSLAATSNTSGRVLRRKIAAMVSGLKNLRDVIEFGSDQPELQRLSVEILYHLAMEEDVRRNIGATGGTIRNLFDLFAKYDSVIESEPDTKKREQRKVASEKAGEALTRLMLQNERNCKRLLHLEPQDGANDKPLVNVMLDSLDKPDTIASSAAKILRNVLKYADEKSTKVEISSGCIPVMKKNVFITGPLTKSEMYEASLGLASRAVEFLDVAKYVDIVQNVNKTEFVDQLIKNLQHTPTTNKYPRIRRYSVELILALTAKDDSFLDAFQGFNPPLKKVLKKTLDSISEVENFCLFSGLIGYTRHNEEMEDLVERCIKAVDDYHKRAISSSETSL